jgi:threonine synthase
VLRDKEILAAQRWLANHEGIFVEPASAASVAGLLKWCDSEDAAFSFRNIPERSRIVCTVTGHGLKDPEVIVQQFAEFKTVAATVEDVRHAIEL